MAAPTERIFGQLQRGIKFNSSKLQSDRKPFQSNSTVGTTETHSDDAELDFFGFGTLGSSTGPVPVAPVGSKQPETEAEAQKDVSSSENDDDEKEEETSDEEEDEICPVFGSSSSAVETTQEPVEKKQQKHDEIDLFRKKMGIKVNGSVVPELITEFKQMQFPKEKEAQKLFKIVLKNVELSQYKEPTPVQMQAIPSMLLNRDVLAIAPTGSGKTAAFVLPLLAKLQQASDKGIRGIILAPTRELAKQIHMECLRLCKGKKMRICLLTKATAATVVSQIKSNSLKQDLLVATPLRLVHLIQDHKVDLSLIETICLDEADRLFDMGFVEQIDEIMAACSNKDIQRAMFSATMLQGVEDMAKSVLRDPVRISIGVKNAGADTIEQKLVFVGREEGKLLAIKQLIYDGFKPPALIFVQNKERAQELYDELIFDGINVGVIHSDRTKQQRDDTIKAFRLGQVWVLIATDIMSRGMDFKGVNLVINYDFPQSAVSYIHRIGRTGRAGRQGQAITLYTEYDMNYLRSIAHVIKLSGGDVPDWMLSLKKLKSSEKKNLVKRPPKRHRISTMSGFDRRKLHKKKAVILSQKSQEN